MRKASSPFDPAIRDVQAMRSVSESIARVPCLTRYHLIPGGLSHGQRPPRQRLRSGPSLVLNHAAASASDTSRLVWFLRRCGAFFGMGNQVREARVTVQRLEIGIFLELERNIGGQSVVDCLSQKGEGLVRLPLVKSYATQVVCGHRGIGMVGSEDAALNGQSLTF